ncbi:MAG: Gfo/Idh/MocA family oxidoreductase [bacterium]|nr:Gfo/Idh/MocA family oxidoreductase [bacterium]
MKQLFKTRLKELHIVEVPAPSCGDKEVLIEVMNSLISPGSEAGSGIESSGDRLNKITGIAKNVGRIGATLQSQGLAGILRKSKNLDNISSDMGYSLSGVVLKTGKDVSGFKPGDRVAAGGAGYACHAEIAAVPENLVVPIPPELSFPEAAFTTLGSIALQGVRQARLSLGENVVVIGLGLVGMLTVKLAKAAGCRVIGIDISKTRIDFALKQGLDSGFITGEEPAPRVLECTDNIGADSVIICAATDDSGPVNLAMELARKKGRVVVVGAVGMNIDRTPFYEKEIEFTISCSYGPGRYDPLYEEKGIDYPVGYVRWTEKRNMQAFAAMAGAGVALSPLISHRFSIEKAPLAFETIAAESEQCYGVILDYPQGSQEEKLKQSTPQRETPNIENIPKNIISIAVVGAGGYTTGTHLPIIARIKDLNLKTVAAKSGKSAKRAASDFDAEYCSTAFEEILEDKSIDAVLIATRHNLHFPMAEKALKAEKHCLLEKPMGLTSNEIDRLTEQAETGNGVFTVGYNRRYSPFALKIESLIKEEKAKKESPMIINYRVNAGFVPPDHWTRDPEIGGGRIIGEACHFFDLFNFFTGQEPVDISAQGAPESCIAAITYPNGSIANLVYSSLGSPELPKEYCEIHCNGKSIIIDDFKTLQLYGFGRFGKKRGLIRLKKQDKGHEQQTREFVKKIRGEDSLLLSVHEAALAARMAITVRDLCR